MPFMHSKLLSDPNTLDELWQKCTLPSATVNKFQKGQGGLGSQASWLLMDMKEQFRKHLSAFTSIHASRQVSSGQALTNLRLDTLSPWNMPVPRQWVTGQGLTLVLHVQRGGERKRVFARIRSQVDSLRYQRKCPRRSLQPRLQKVARLCFLFPIRCYALDGCLALSYLIPDRIWFVSSDEFSSGSTISHCVLL